MTVQEFINSVLRLIQVLDSGEAPSTSESNDAFTALNEMIANWSAAGVPVYRVSRDQFSLTGLNTYTIGTGGAIATERPLKIRAANISAVAGGSLPIDIIKVERWAAIRDKTRAGKFAQVLYYDGAYPLGNIWLWPTPATGGTLELYSVKQLTQFPSLSTTIDLPPGYEQALRFALASVLAPEYGSVLSPEVATNAAEAKQAIAILNADVLGPAVPPAPAVTPAPAPAA
jgi:hypothetical protein